MDELTERIAARTLELVGIPSVSRDEGGVLDAIDGAMPWAPHAALDACRVYLPRRREGAELVLLAGHVDTVPQGGAAPPSRDAAAVVGRGAADMKAGCAVMVEVARDLEAGVITSDLDLGWVFVGREELPADESALRPALEAVGDLRAASLAIVMEPTANVLELGCIGNLNAEVTIRGTAAHSARPWLGDNAIHRAISVLGALAEAPVRDVDVDGLVYREAVSVTTIAGGVALNVIPDLVTAHVNLRYAPATSATEAEDRLRSLVDGAPHVEVEVRSNAPSGPVPSGNPLVERLRAAGDLPTGPKQAWTPVAEFAEAGVDAVNFGPGDPKYAHHDDERVEIPALARSAEVLRAFLGGPGGRA